MFAFYNWSGYIEPLFQKHSQDIQFTVDQETWQYHFTNQQISWKYVSDSLIPLSWNSCKPCYSSDSSDLSMEESSKYYTSKINEEMHLPEMWKQLETFY